MNYVIEDQYWKTLYHMLKKQTSKYAHFKDNQFLVKAWMYIPKYHIAQYAIKCHLDK